MSEWSDMSTHGLLYQSAYTMCLSEVTCLPMDCYISQLTLCVWVKWHVYPWTVISVSLHYVSEWSDMSTHGPLYQSAYTMCLSEVTCLPMDCYISQLTLCVWVKWHVYPWTVISVSLHYVSEWSDMSTHGPG